MERLVQQTELRNEQLIHYGRLAFWLLLAALIVVPRLERSPSGPWLLVLLVGSGLLLWAIVWVLLWRAGYRPWLKYVTIALDTFLLVRFVPLLALQPEWGTPLEAVLTRDDVTRIMPLALVLLIVTASLRLSRRAVVLATVLGASSLVLSNRAFDVPTDIWAPQLALLGLVGIASLVAAQRLRVLVRLVHEERLIEPYVPAALIGDLTRAADPEHIDREEVVSVLFADMRGYTTLVEPMTPANAIAYLNRYFTAIVPAVTAEGGNVDKYIGDGLLAFFTGPGHAARAVTAAKRILENVRKLNEQRDGLPPLRVGVAVHSGPALIGTVGTPLRREYTVIGDTVNVAARLEELNKELGSQLLVSATTWELIEDVRGAAVAHTVTLRGRAEPIEVFCLA